MTTTISTRSAGTMNPTRQQLDELDALLQRMLELPVSKSADSEPMEDDDAAPEPSFQELMPSESVAAPVSYMVVETASPRPLPPASGFEPQPSALTPRLVPVTPDSRGADATPLAPAVDTTPPAAGDVEANPSAEEQLWVPLRSTWQPSPQTWPPLADSWHQANDNAPESVEPPRPQLEIDLPASVPFPALTEPEPVDSKEEITPPAPVIEPRLSLSAEDAPAAPSVLLPLVWFNQGFDACLTPLGAPGRWLSGPGGRQLLGFVGLTCLAAATAIAILAGLGCTW